GRESPPIRIAQQYVGGRDVREATSIEAHDERQSAARASRAIDVREMQPPTRTDPRCAAARLGGGHPLVQLLEKRRDGRAQRSLTIERRLDAAKSLEHPITRRPTHFVVCTAHLEQHPCSSRECGR